MEFEEYDIVKLYDKLDEKVVYIAILRTVGDIYLVELLKQPSYNLINKRFSDSIFKQYCHEVDEVTDVNLNFDSNNLTFEIHKNMCQPLNRGELVILLKHLNYIDFGKNKSEKMIISMALDKLI